MVVLVGAVLATLVLGRVAQLRALVPSWRFFDRADAPPTLWLARDDGGWELVTAPARSLVIGWAFAPQANLALAYQMVVDRLVADVSDLDPELPDDAPAIMQLAAYATVTAIARELCAPATVFRWKVVNDGVDFVVSRELAA